MRYFYDWEFLEDGVTIDPISVGVVSEDGREYYAINREVDWDGVLKHEWLPDNVVPHLPTVKIGDELLLNYFHPDVKSRDTIRRELWEFISPDPEDDTKTELYGWCSAYDHVLLAQEMAGPMSEFHGTGMPFFTHDLKAMIRLFWPDLTGTQKAGAAHNALDDARWTRDVWSDLRAAGLI